MGGGKRPRKNLTSQEQMGKRWPGFGSTGVLAPQLVELNSTRKKRLFFTTGVELEKFGESPTLGKG